MLGQRLDTRGSSPALPVADLALATSALVNGLATEELEDPGSVPDELLGELLARLLEPPSDRVKQA